MEKVKEEWEREVIDNRRSYGEVKEFVSLKSREEC